MKYPTGGAIGSIYAGIWRGRGGDATKLPRSRLKALSCTPSLLFFFFFLVQHAHRDLPVAVATEQTIDRLSYTELGDGRGGIYACGGGGWVGDISRERVHSSKFQPEYTRKENSQPNAELRL